MVGTRQGSLGHAQKRFQDNDQNGRLDAEEKRIDERNIAQGGINRRERQNDGSTR